MQEQFEDTSLQCSSKKQKKRLQYKRMSEDKKRDLIFRVMYLNENVRSVCYELGFNFSTGRNLVQRYKKTGEYCPTEKPGSASPPNELVKTGTSNDEGKLRSDKLRKCPFGLMFLADDKIKLVTSRTYAPEEQRTLEGLHHQLLAAGTV